MAKNTKVAKKRAHASVARAFPPAGTILVGRYHGKGHRAAIVERDGRLVVKVGRDAYGSLSAAAQAITGSSVNGWRFWTVA